MNPWKAKARAIKAYALADFLTATCPESLRREGALEVMAEMPSTWWTGIAANAGVKPPSLTTITAVLEILRSRSEAASASYTNADLRPARGVNGRYSSQGRPAASLLERERHPFDPHKELTTRPKR